MQKDASFRWQENAEAQDIRCIQEPPIFCRKSFRVLVDLPLKLSCGPHEKFLHLQGRPESKTEYKSWLFQRTKLDYRHYAFRVTACNAQMPSWSNVSASFEELPYVLHGWRASIWNIFCILYHEEFPSALHRWRQSKKHMHNWTYWIIRKCVTMCMCHMNNKKGSQ